MRRLIPLFLAAGCSASSKPAPPQPPMVRTVMVGAEADGARRLTGEVRARIESDLGFRVGGKIAARLVNAGDRVRAGQVLMRLDPIDLQLASAAARARVASAEAEARRADADLKRLDGLVGLGAISAQSFDSARTAADAARAAVAAARAQAAQAVNASRYAVLTADADGIVTSVLAEPGQVVDAGKAVIRLGRAGPREALVAVPEDLARAAPASASAAIYGSSRAYPATLREVSGSADPASRTYAARYQLVGAEAVPLGTTVTLTLPNGHQSALAVPIGAVRDDGRGPAVFVVDNGRAHLRRVEIAGLSDETVRIAAGLRPGERVVALGTHLLSDGQTVRVAQ
jgi:RND family efflux transporter MFP subunit